jgi:hypothetical protein
MIVDEETIGGTDFNNTYTWDGSTLTFAHPSSEMTFVLHYRESEDVFYRLLDMNDPQTAYFAAILGIEEMVFHRQ